MIALPCSAAFPASGSNMTLINATGILDAVVAPCIIVDQNRKIHFIKKYSNKNSSEIHQQTIQWNLWQGIFSCKISARHNGISFKKQSNNLKWPHIATHKAVIMEENKLLEWIKDKIKIN